MKCKCQLEAEKREVKTGEPSKALWVIGTGLALIVWALLYSRLGAFSEWLVAQTPLQAGEKLHAAALFFFYDTPKVFLLLTIVVFAMGIVRSFFSPEKTRALLSGKSEGAGNIAAACLGIVTPFCSCSAVPLFIGFVSAGIPLGITFSFLISAPMVNEVALVLLFGLLGWKVAAIYLTFGLSIAIIAGWIIGRLKLESWLEDWVRDARGDNAKTATSGKITLVGRIKAGLDAVKEIISKVWPWMLAGIAAGAFIHGYTPVEFLSAITGKGAWWSVPAVVALGVPMYSNAAGIIPVAEALLNKGVDIGTVLAFMMSVTALSLPEMIILRKVLKPKLVAVFFGTVAVGILLTGYLFNALLG